MKHPFFTQPTRWINRSMEFPGSLNRWDRYHIIPQLAGTIPLIYHFLSLPFVGDYISPSPPIKGTFRNSYWTGLGPLSPFPTKVSVKVEDLIGPSEAPWLVGHGVGSLPKIGDPVMNVTWELGWSVLGFLVWFWEVSKVRLKHHLFGELFFFGLVKKSWYRPTELAKWQTFPSSCIEDRECWTILTLGMEGAAGKALGKAFEVVKTGG